MILEEAPVAEIMRELERRFDAFVFQGMQALPNPHPQTHDTEDGGPCAEHGCDRRYRWTYGDAFRKLGLVHVLGQAVSEDAMDAQPAEEP